MVAVEPDDQQERRGRRSQLTDSRKVAERQGFEPWVPGLPIHVISRTAPGDPDDDMPELNPS